jgi:ABC-type Mn2+/Zn2+ transport system ATPase subunit/GNAT superfamily N-acetyltransferase
MHLTHTISCPILPTFRVKQITGLFDLPEAPESRETFAVELPSVEEDWTIGAIVGPSGSGKTTIAKAAFGGAVMTSFAWPRNKAVIDGFDERLPIKEVIQMLGAVGFNSPPAWLRPYHVLSNGERFRCDLARALLSSEPLIVCDEFTSVVDRTVAKVASAALAKTLRRESGKRFVAVTCHYDVVEWLEVDWVLDMATQTLSRGRLRRPAIELSVVSAPHKAWPLFARHHYLSGSLSRGATCYVALWHDEPVAFCATIRTLGRRGHKRVTRLVTLPDYQGLGIGTRLLEHVGELVLGLGERLGITTSHPSMCRYLNASPRWLCRRLRRSYRPAPQFFRNAAVRDSYGRLTASFEFLG